MEPVILVHGGAGNDFDDRLPEFRAGVERAARAGWDVLRQGGSALDACEAAVRVLEDDPNFDAGHGSFLNSNNEVEMDAMVMDGARLGYGAVAGIQRVANPVSVARLVMERTQHSIFVGAGAEQFARAQGVPVCPMDELVARHLLCEAVERALEELPARQAQVVQLRYGLKGDPPCTLETIAQKLSLSRERVRQIERDAFARLRRSADVLGQWLPQSA